MKKWILIITSFLIVCITFLGLGRFKSEEELAIELEKITKKEKEEKMNFKLNDINKENYDLIKTTKVSELGMDIVELEHKVTKCKIVLMICDDENKTFNISFKTYPYSNNGICHIMEHSVLCGSKKYNIKDPFFAMAKSSLATYMNAMTGSDMTYFPVASTNEQDFKNLMDVYLDAVFFPNIYTNYNILRQEGWHYEIDKESDDLKVNGIVLNEMKGANSVPSDCIDRYIMKDLFGGTSYSYNVGGEPNEIINITQEEFENFHKMYYSPSNAYIYIYGLLDMNERLQYMHDEYLSKFDFVEVDIPEFDINNIECADGQYYYDSDTKEKNKSYIAYNFAFDDDKDNLKYIVNSILFYILFDKEGALIKEKLVAKGLGEDISIMYENGCANGFVSIIAENIDEEKKDEFIENVDNMLEEIIENGIDEKILQSAINCFYLKCVENDNGSTGRGLEYTMESLDSYSYGYDVDNFIKYKEAFEIIENEDLSSNDNIFINRIMDMFINCNNKCITVLSPKSGVIAKEEKELKKVLQERKEKMLSHESDVTLKTIIDEYKNFKYYLSINDTEEDIKKMPKLNIEDIEREEKYVTSEEGEIYGKKIIQTFDNVDDLAYIGVDFLLPKKDEDFPDSEKYFLSVAFDFLGILDTENYNYDELNTEFDMYTSGLSSEIIIIENQPALRVSTKTKIENIKKAYDLINEVLFNTKFDDSRRIKQKITELKVASNEGLTSYVNTASKNRAASKISYSYSLVDKMKNGNIAYDLFVNDLVKVYNNKSTEIDKSLEQVLKKYISYDKMFLDCCIKKDNYDEYENSTRDFLKEAVELSKNNNINKVLNIDNILDFSMFDRTYTMEAFITNTNANFVARAFSYDEELYNGHMLVLNNIIDYDYLHQQIRVKGGAYGSKLQLDKYGTMVFYSYSDPHLIETDNVYKNTIDFVKNMKISDDDLYNNIIGSVKKTNMYGTPFSRHRANITLYISKTTNEMMNKIRGEILDTTEESLKKSAEALNNLLDKSEFCAIITAENESISRDVYKIVRKIK